MLFVFTVLIFSSKTFSQVAPVNPPTGGFNIDGNVQATTDPVGDWLQGPSSGGYVLHNDGSPVDPTHTFFVSDLFNDALDDVFKEGNVDNTTPISSLGWQYKASLDKCDIGHALVHISKDPNTNDTWIMLAGDRLSSGSSNTIDFELLQNPVVKNADFTFTGTGPDDGRTINDLLIEVNYPGGSGAASFTFSKWDGSTWVSFTPAGSPFAVTNVGTVNVPYGAFGNTTYSDGQFVEGAVDVTAVINSIQETGGCPVSIGVKNIWVKTSTSGQGTGTLKDFIAPIDFSVNIGKPTGTDAGRCGPGDVTLHAAADGSGFTLNWYSDAGLTNLVATGGTYTATGLTETTTYYVTQSKAGCTSAATEVTATVSSTPSLEISSKTDVLCFGNSTGAVDLGVSGGTPNFSYAWTKDGDNNFSASTQDLNNVSAGTYNVLVTDHGGCTANTSATVGQPESALTASKIEGTIKCHNDQTTVTITASGGTAPYTGDGEQVVSAGPYSFDVTDAHGCTVNVSGTITAPDALTASATDGTISCHGGTTTVTITASGGTQPYSGDGAHTVSAGPYSFDVFDAGGCKYTVSGNISEPDAISANAVATDAKCNGNANGSVDLTVSGGTGGYTYLWSNNATTQDLTNVAANTYTVTVTDANSCTAGTSATVHEPTVLTCSAVQVSQRGCSTTVNDGSATVTASGGNGGYGYLWDDNETSATATQLTAGNHSVSVTDSKGCTTSCNVTIGQKVCTGIYPTSTSCAGYNSGTIQFLSKVCLTTQKKKGSTSTTVSNATPGVFFYYAKITAPQAAFDVYVDQTQCAGISKPFLIASGQIFAYKDNCTKLGTGTTMTNGDGVIHITKATAGQPVIIGVKYDTKSVIGATVSGSFPCTATWVVKDGLGTPFAGTTTSLSIGTNCSVAAIAATLPSSSDELRVNAYPNPFKDKVSFKFTSPVSGKAVLEAYDLMGRKLAVIYQGTVDAGVERMVTYNVPAGTRVAMMYRLTVGDKSYHAMIMPEK